MKILFPGAAAFQLPPIQYALAKGYEVITADNRPQNPGHGLAARSYNISAADWDAITDIAKREKVNAIVPFASDVGAVSAAYACERLQLPSSPYKSVLTLANKAHFRRFMQQSGIAPVNHRAFAAAEQHLIPHFMRSMGFPAVIKPVDASGSKGVALIREENELEPKLKAAYDASLSQTVIMERFIPRFGRQICGDGFMQHGKLTFIYFGDGYFYEDKKYLAPYAESFPSTHSPQILQKVQMQLQTILQKVNYHTGAFNFDVWITTGNEVFVNEIGPRSGGNYLPLAIQLMTGVDMTAAAVECAINPVYAFDFKLKKSDGFYACYMLHAKKAGFLKGVRFSPEMASHIVKRHPYLSIGERVKPFTQANHAIGHIMLRFDAFNEMQEKMAAINQYCTIELA